MEDKFKRAVIIGSGEDVPGEAPIIAKDTLVIAADGGLKQAYQWGLTPIISLVILIPGPW